MSGVMMFFTRCQWYWGCYGEQGSQLPSVVPVEPGVGQTVGEVVTAVPEPATAVLVVLGLVLMALWREVRREER